MKPQISFPGKYTYLITELYVCACESSVKISANQYKDYPLSSMQLVVEPKTAGLTDDVMKNGRQTVG